MESSKSGTRLVEAMLTRGLRVKMKKPHQMSGRRSKEHCDGQETKFRNGGRVTRNEYQPCAEGQIHPGSPPDPSRKLSCVRKQLHGVRVTWPAMDTPEPRFMATGY